MIAPILAVQEMPTSVWPVTVAGWVALGLSAASAIGVIYGLHRFSQKPVLSSIAGLQAHCDAEIRRVQKHYDDQLAQLAKTTSADLMAFAASVTKDVNGWSARIVESAGRIEEQQRAMDGLYRVSAVQETEQEHMSKALERIERGLDEIRRRGNP